MSELKVNAVVDAAGGNTATINGMTPTADSLQGFRNRILNGGMVLDQRNAGAAVTVNSGSDFFPVDRFNGTGQSSDGVFTLQQDSSAPAGFSTSLKLTVTTADASIGSSQRYVLRQAIEGYNVADLAFGTASAQSVTVSFWVRSSLTGTFSGALLNSAQNRSYPFSYTISAADTWEQKSVTIAGDTTGTWLTTNGVGMTVGFDVGCGSTLKGTADEWTGSAKWGVTGATDIIATVSATFYITGVQLEAGSVATPFERRPYGTELALCQRYCQVLSHANGDRDIATGVIYTSTASVTVRQFPTIMRSGPTLTASGLSDIRIYQGNANFTPSAIVLDRAGPTTFTFSSTISGATQGQGCWLRLSASTAKIELSAEL